MLRERSCSATGIPDIQSDSRHRGYTMTAITLLALTALILTAVAQVMVWTR